jgi:hypothetical protein
MRKNKLNVKNLISLLNLNKYLNNLSLKIEMTKEKRLEQITSKWISVVIISRWRVRAKKFGLTLD